MEIRLSNEFSGVRYHRPQRFSAEIATSPCQRQLKIVYRSLSIPRSAGASIFTRLLANAVNRARENSGVRAEVERSHRDQAHRVDFRGVADSGFLAETRLSFEKVKKKRFPLRWKTLYGAARLCFGKEYYVFKSKA